MNELIKGMLSVGSRLSPDDGSSVVVNASSMVRYVLPIGLHVPLNYISLDFAHVMTVFKILKNNRVHTCWKYAVKRCMYWS